MIWLQTLIFLALLPVLEIMVIVRTGQALGVWVTLGLLLVFGLGGILVAKRQGTLVLRNVFRDLQIGRVPAESLLQGILIALGGLLLLMPGFVSDGLGLLCLIPTTRRWLAVGLRHVITRQMRQAKFQVNFGRVDEYGHVNWQSARPVDPEPVFLPDAQIIPVDFSLKRKPDSPNP